MNQINIKNDLKKENKKKIITYLKGIFTIILFFFSPYFAKIPILIFHINKSNLSDTMSILLSLFSNLMLVLILFVIYHRSLKEEWQKFWNNREQNLDMGFKYWLIGLIIMMITNIIINFCLAHNIANNEQSVQAMIKASPWLMLINAGILAPITEEITFRKTFKDMIKNKWLFILISGIFFGFLHVISATTFYEFLYIIPYSALGISFAIMYQKTDTVFTSMLMHFFHNTVLTLISILPLLT